MFSLSVESIELNLLITALSSEVWRSSLPKSIEDEKQSGQFPIFMTNKDFLGKIKTKVGPSAAASKLLFMSIILAKYANVVCLT